MLICDLDIIARPSDVWLKGKRVQLSTRDHSRTQPGTPPWLGLGNLHGSGAMEALGAEVASLKQQVATLTGTLGEVAQRADQCIRELQGWDRESKDLIAKLTKSDEASQGTLQDLHKARSEFTLQMQALGITELR